MVVAAIATRHSLTRATGAKAPPSRHVARMAVQELPALQGPVLGKKYHGPHKVAKEGRERIEQMLADGDMFRYGGNDEGSLQVLTSGFEYILPYVTRPWCMVQHPNSATDSFLISNKHTRQFVDSELQFNWWRSFDVAQLTSDRM